MEQEVSLDLMEMMEIIKKKLWLIVSVTTALVVVTGIFSFFVISPTYEASTSIIIGKEQATASEKSNLNYSDMMMYQQMAKTYAEIAKSRLVAEKTAEKLGGGILPEDIMRAMMVTPQANTQILVIKLKDKDREAARNKVNALAKCFIEETQRYYPSGSVQIMDIATLPKAPIKPRPVLNLAIAFFLGVMLSVGIIFLMEYMDSTIKTEQDIERYLELPVIGIIPKQEEK